MTECKRGRCGLHCQCYQDIDHLRDGCVWCQVLAENEKALDVQIERDRYKAALEEISIKCSGATPNTLARDAREIADKAIDQSTEK